MADDTMAYDHLLTELVPEGAVALCGDRAYAGHPLMFGSGQGERPPCPECLAASAAVGKNMPTFAATVAVGKRMAP